MSWYHTSNGSECAAVGCEIRVNPRRLMCSRHWRLVPDAMRDAIATGSKDERADAELDAVECVGETA